MRTMFPTASRVKEASYFNIVMFSNQWMQKVISIPLPNIGKGK